MIKGVGKQIVLLHNTESEIFEQAIFILKSGGKVPYQNMIKECERMISTHITAKRRGSKNRCKIAFIVLLIMFVILGAYVIWSEI